MNATRARTLGIYCAVEPDNQGETVTGAGVVLSLDSRLRRNFLTGTVLCVGPKVSDQVSVGQTVVYERESAHPSQTGPIDASIFGGSVNRYAVVLPLYPSALKSVADLEEELVKRKADVDALATKAETQSLTDDDVAALEVHERRVRELDEMRTGRARGQARRKLNDNAKGSGIVAILEAKE